MLAGSKNAFTHFSKGRSSLDYFNNPDISLSMDSFVWNPPRYTDRLFDALKLYNAG